MKDPYFNQCILCTVKSCKFYCKENQCSLGKITVSNDCNGTKCASFKEKK